MAPAEIVDLSTQSHAILLLRQSIDQQVLESTEVFPFGGTVNRFAVVVDSRESIVCHDDRQLFHLHQLG